MEANFTQSLFEAIVDSAVLVDKAGRIIDWNAGANHLFGYSKKEVLGRSVNLIYQQNHPFPKIIQEVLPSHKKWIEETQYIRKNGIKGLCKTCLGPVLQHDTTKAAALITHHTITSYKNEIEELRKKTEFLQNEFKKHAELFYLSGNLLINNITKHDQLEANLRESELSFHLLAENATDIISRHTPDGAYLYISPSCKTLQGYLSEELMNRNIYKLVHHDDINKVKKAFSRRKDITLPHSVVYRIRRKDGEYRWFESNVRIITDENTKAIREVQLASRDVTERIIDKKARLRGRQLAHIYRLSTMEEMASGMAHEISQPIAAIVNYTQGTVRHLQRGDHNPEQLIEVMKKAVAQAQRVGEVIHRLKNFFCKGQLYKTPCKINNVIRETLTLIRDELTASKVKVEFNLAKNIPMISIDKIQLQQVLLNLFQNGIEAMQETHLKERKMQVQTKQVDRSTIEVTVSDAGPGFSKEIITKVFKPFFTTKAHGTGMGLAICRSIIEAHGGEFSINPNHHQQSWIRFTLPICLEKIG